MLSSILVPLLSPSNQVMGVGIALQQSEDNEGRGILQHYGTVSVMAQIQITKDRHSCNQIITTKTSHPLHDIFCSETVSLSYDIDVYTIPLYRYSSVMSYSFSLSIFIIPANLHSLKPFVITYTFFANSISIVIRVGTSRSHGDGSYRLLTSYEKRSWLRYMTIKEL